MKKDGVPTDPPCGEMTLNFYSPRHKAFRMRSVCCGVLGVLSFLAGYAGADNNFQPGPPPRGWSEEAYSPTGDGTPNFGDDYQGDTENYDAREDPFHPLQNPRRDPGAEWEGAHGAGLNNTFVGTGGGDWDLGERYYGAVFDGPLEVNNQCNSPQPVGIFVNKLPFLSFPPNVVVPPGKTTVIGTFRLPEEPPPPLHAGEGHIDFGTIIIPPGMMPPPTLHQPSFEEIDGTVVVWHPWSPKDDCNAARMTYSVTGHIHFNPPAPDEGPQRLATTDICTLYWNLGVAPDQLGDRDCTQEIRALAAAFIERYLAPYVQNAPEQWMWLPASSDIGSMSIEQLLAMKARAEAVMGRRASIPSGDSSATAGMGPSGVGGSGGEWQHPSESGNPAGSTTGGPLVSEGFRVAPSEADTADALRLRPGGQGAAAPPGSNPNDRTIRDPAREGTSP